MQQVLNITTATNRYIFWIQVAEPYTVVYICDRALHHGLHLWQSFPRWSSFVAEPSTVVFICDRALHRGLHLWQSLPLWSTFVAEPYTVSTFVAGPFLEFPSKRGICCHPEAREAQETLWHHFWLEKPYIVIYPSS